MPVGIIWTAIQEIDLWLLLLLVVSVVIVVVLVRLLRSVHAVERHLAAMAGNAIPERSVDEPSLASLDGDSHSQSELVIPLARPSFYCPRCRNPVAWDSPRCPYCRGAFSTADREALQRVESGRLDEKVVAKKEGPSSDATDEGQ